jgi:hypothetical protein
VESFYPGGRETSCTEISASAATAAESSAAAASESSLRAASSEAFPRFSAHEKTKTKKYNQKELDNDQKKKIPGIFAAYPFSFALSFSACFTIFSRSAASVYKTTGV